MQNGKTRSPIKLVEMTQKKWGHEECFANTDRYCGKILAMKHGWKASMHRHLVKDETFYLYKGEARLEYTTDNGALVIARMTEGDTIHIPPGTWHRLTAVVDCTIIEASTHHSDEDVERRIESCLDEEIAARRMNRAVDFSHAPSG